MSLVIAQGRTWAEGETVTADRLNTAPTMTLATSKLVGRSTAGTGAAEEIDCTAAGRNMIAAADVAAQRALLSVGNFLNKIINGNFDVWQRGTGSTSCTAGTRTFLADRWAVLAAGAAPTQQRSTTTPNFRSRYSLLLTGAASVTTVDVAQRIDAQSVNTGLRTTVTVSAYVRNGSGAAFTPTLIIRTPSAEDNWTVSTDRVTQVLASCADGAWTQVSHSFDASALTNVANGLEVVIQIPSGSCVSGDTVHISQVDIREGSAIGALEVVPYVMERARCLLFYEIVSGLTSGTFLGVGSTRTGSVCDFVWKYETPKRTAPTVTRSAFAHFGILTTGGLTDVCTTVTVSAAYISHARLGLVSASMPAAGGGAMVMIADSLATLTIDAEL